MFMNLSLKNHIHFLLLSAAVDIQTPNGVNLFESFAEDVAKNRNFVETTAIIDATDSTTV